MLLYICTYTAGHGSILLARLAEADFDNWQILECSKRVECTQQLFTTTAAAATAAAAASHHDRVR
jgi:hypothetical protein